jgi:hypothetical protein
MMFSVFGSQIHDGSGWFSKRSEGLNFNGIGRALFHKYSAEPEKDTAWKYVRSFSYAWALRTQTERFV